MDSSGPDSPRIYNFSRERSGQSEPLAVILLLGLVITGTTIVVGLGSQALDETRSQSDLERVEQTMTLFDSKAATVALGDADVKTLSLGKSAGGFTVDESAGRITIVHLNYDGSGSKTQLYQDEFGAVVYESDGTSIAYQGGGVWTKDRSSGSRMVSPPEFHYRDGTLTLPIIHTEGSGGVGGGGRVEITESVRGAAVYPDRSQTYPGSSETYSNPVSDGFVMVKVQSEYYQAWADFFEERTEGKVNSYAGNETATVALISLGQRGPFRMPGEGSGIEIRGLEDHTMTDFDVTLRPDDADSADFSNLQWSFSAEEDDQQFELFLRKSGGSGCSVDISTTVYYSGDGGDSYHGWQADDVFTTICDDFDNDGDDDVKLDADLLSSEQLTFQSLSSNDLLYFNPNGDFAGASDGTVTFSHSEDPDPGVYAAGDQLSLETLTNHYFALLGPTFHLTVDDKNSDTVSEDFSDGVIEYEGSGDFVTYLHVSENRIVVKFE
ncbi:DUF7289 family protein [Halogranum rubrum]|uniref:DUF7308 domain-containing protein n=1 Tax=Halogranum salarium B-1 TaxID=1210908 RepID=J3JGM5_9EURY|nr:hypothetical protein [Halogranum salarium]EJN60264.1 hypothetical protein HSB1_08670 [Halogranum salarium B-1]